MQRAAEQPAKKRQGKEPKHPKHALQSQKNRARMSSVYTRAM